MKAKFINVDMISLFPEGEEEKMIFDRFVGLVQNHKYELYSNGAVSTEDHYVSFQVGIKEKVTE